MSNLLYGRNVTVDKQNQRVHSSNSNSNAKHRIKRKTTDGTHQADSSRGARYNSAVRYDEQLKNSVAVVVSQDGMVDIIPRRLLTDS